MRTRRPLPLWLPFALLAAMILLLYHPLLRSETLFWGLPTLQFYPWRELAFEQLRDGTLPTWNPYLGAGAPLLANYQTAVFYPPNWLWLALPGTLVMSVVALLHIIWAGAGMWLFTGALGYTRFGRAVSMLAFAFSGYGIARLGSFPTANAVAWLPWLFWLLHRILHRRRTPDVAWLGLAFGLQLLAGHAQTAWYGAVGLGLYAAWIAGWQMHRERIAVRILSLALAGTGMLLGGLVAAIQLIPTAEYLAESQRSGGLDYETLTNLSYHPFRLLTLLSPNFLGTPADGSYLTKGIYFEDAAYIGFVPLIAAVAALWAWARQVRARRVESELANVPFWVLLVVIGFVFALGKYGPFFRALYDHVPTFDAFREPVRWLILPVFALSTMAGAGVSHWGRGPRIVFWSRLAGAGGGAMALMALAGVLFGDFSETLEVLSWGMIVLGSWMAIAALLTLIHPLPPLAGSRRVWRGVVLVFIALDLAWAAGGLNPTVDADFYDARSIDMDGRVYWFDDYEHAITFGSEEDSDSGEAESGTTTTIEGYFDVTDYRIAVHRQDELRDALLPNITMLDRVPALSNNDPLLPGHYTAYIDLIESMCEESGPLLRAAGVGRVYGLIPSGWVPVGEMVAETPYDPVFAWLVPSAVWFEDSDSVEAGLRDPDWSPAETVILAGEPGESSAGEVEARSAEGEVARLNDDPAEHHYHVNSPEAAYLVIAETWYPGWSVAVNGAEADLHRANGAFMAVAVPAGESEVVLRYRLNRWPLAAGITLAALFLALLLIAAPQIVTRLRRDND